MHDIALVKILSINYYCRADIDEAKVISVVWHKLKFNFNLFWKEISNFWVSML